MWFEDVNVFGSTNKLTITDNIINLVDMNDDYGLTMVSIGDSLLNGVVENCIPLKYLYNCL